MRIVWDEAKRQENIRKHGYDFAVLDLAFFDNAIIAEAKFGRLKALGKLEGDYLASIFATLGSEGISIISLRPASKVERLKYEQAKSSA